MSRPKPFSNLSPVGGRLADITARVYFDGHCPTLTILPQPVILFFNGLQTDLADAELKVESGDLLLSVYSTATRRELLTSINLDEPVMIMLRDGSSVRCDLICRIVRGSVFRSNGQQTNGMELKLASWQWTHPDTKHPVFIAELEGLPKPPGDNLVVVEGLNWSSGHFRGEGAFTWHIVEARADKSCWAVLEARAEEPTNEALRRDLLAMNFVAGGQVRLRTAWAVDPTGIVVGALSPAWSHDADDRQRPPVPTGRLENICWAAPLFAKLSRQLATDADNLCTALAGYAGALSSHIHCEYLVAQVALEAFCQVITAKANTPPLVSSIDGWKQWIAEHEAEIIAHGRSDVDGQLLLRKLRDNVFQRPSGEVVQSAFRVWGIDLPPEVSKEIRRRNRVVHEYRMFDESTGCFKEAATRVDIIQMLLAGAIAIHIGYGGPIVGWTRDERGHLEIAPFWPDSSDRDERAAAQVRYSCTTRGQGSSSSTT